ncbi:MAG: domain family protein [Polaromonas sp.]|nr:domain family protein [Polaromonas sp.]
MNTQAGQFTTARTAIPPAYELEDERQRTLIHESHQRSQSFGIAHADRPDFSVLGQVTLAQTLEENRFLLLHAAPAMETLYEQIVNTHSMVLLTSAQGVVLHSLGDSDFLEKASQVALTPGVDWSEKSKGTNAIGTALREEQAIMVHGSEHYMNANKFLTCSCAPIMDPHGQLIGALDVTGDHRSVHQHTMALVRMSAQMIENHMFADIFPKAVRIHFHSRPEFIGTLVEGIVVFSVDGRFLSANRSAQFQLGLSHNALKVHTFSSLFGIAMSRLFELCRGGVPRIHPLCLYNGVTVSCRVKIKQGMQWFTGAAAGSGFEPAGAMADQGVSEATLARKSQLSTLRYLDTGDPQVSAVINKLRMVRGRDIPIMILGETGTGKDLMAQAIHGDSDRAGKPFVSVNCASIPETLIESELFGYEDGAFTGARKKGAAGKIQQANGGTLFLDEIGDMPRHLQARLLRVLQDRRVSPLGAGKEVEVDIAIVCATNKSLKDMIARGEFREDLYYRLNGLVVRLPALRERTDFDLVVTKIIGSLCDKSLKIGLSAEVLSMFHAYHWPGNFRQLHNLLRTAVVMVGCDGMIERSHLPDDFLEELAHQPAAEPWAPTAALGAAPAQAAPLLHGRPASAASGHSLQDVALSAMAQMLRQHRGNVSAAAKALGVSRNTIYRKKDQLPQDVWN